MTYSPCDYHMIQGCGPTVVRAMVVNAAQLASYSQAKQFLLSTGIIIALFTLAHVIPCTDYFTDNILAHFVASMISGFVTTIASLPVDITKTR